jgi:hypothetical protein
MWVLVPFASAAPLDDDALRAKLSARAKAEIPADLFCVARPELPETFGGEPAALGVQVKGVGCRLKAVHVHGELLDPGKGLPASIGAEAWTKLAAPARQDAVARWTHQVLLAFDQPAAADQVVVEAAGGGLTVRVPFDQRIPGTHASARTDGVWTYDAAGLVTAAQRDGGTPYATRFYMKLTELRGVSEQGVSDAMTARGSLIQACVREAWLHDLDLEDRAKIGWDIAGGKASNITGKGESPPALLQCYANAITRLEFPPEMAGHVEWQFAILRGQADPTP